MGAFGIFWDEKKRSIKSHYNSITDALYSNGVINILRNLESVYFQDNKPKLKWAIVDFLILVLILSFLADIGFFIIGTFIGQVSMDKTMLITNEGHFPIEEKTLSEEYNCWVASYGSSVKKELDIGVEWTFGPLIEGTRFGNDRVKFRRDHNLSEYNLPYFVSISKIYYCEDEFDKENTDDKVGPVGHKDIKDIIVVGTLLRCFDGPKKSKVEQETCTAYPLVLSQNISIIAQNNDFKLEIVNLSLDYSKSKDSGGNKHIEIGNIELNYIITRRVNRPLFYITEGYVMILPRLFAPYLIDVYDWIKATIKTDFM